MTTSLHLFHTVCRAHPNGTSCCYCAPGPDCVFDDLKWIDRTFKDAKTEKDLQRRNRDETFETYNDDGKIFRDERDG